jgi:regulator of cell morphogenesis and NO signaling
MPFETTTHLSDIAVAEPLATRIFHAHGLDFCCHGRRPLAEACAERSLEPARVLEEIEQERRAARSATVRWDTRPLDELIDFIVDHYHARLRRELPELRTMAEKVEQVHADKSSCPRGLARHLALVEEAVSSHLAKEEQVLFPLIRAGRGQTAGGPIQCMEAEHDDHAENLARLRELTAELTAPPEACTTWQALYGRLLQLERELMEHIHLENNVLFPRALCA